MNRYFEKIAEKSAVIITGNPNFIRNTKARSFYDDLQSHLESNGYTVTRDPGKAFTKPVDADLWVAHSKGVNRLKFAPPNTKTIAVGAPEVKGSVTHPDDLAVGGERPTSAHFTLTPEMKAAIDSKLVAPNFKALAAGPKGSLHTALGIKPGVLLPEDLLAHAAEHHEDPAIRTRAQMILETKRWRAYKMLNSGNPYLEKVAENLEKQALNALKARQMAREVGVIADHESNWKYALRNLRDGRGAPLQGRERREALTRLAGGRDIVREHQQMSAAQRKLRDVDEIQQVNSKGKTLVPPTALFGTGHMSPEAMAADPLIGKNHQEFLGQVMDRHTPRNSHQLSLSHVHPNLSSSSAPKIVQYGRDINKQKGFAAEAGSDPRAIEDDFTHRFGRSDTPHRLAGASGGFGPQQAMRHMDKPQRAKLVAGDSAIPKMEQAAAASDYEAYSSAMTEFTENTKKLKYQQQEGRMGGMTGDQAAFSQVYHNQVNPIHAPSANAVGLHKVTTGGPNGNIPIGRRSVYLDMTPRKMKTN